MRADEIVDLLDSTATPSLESSRASSPLSSTCSRCDNHS